MPWETRGKQAYYYQNVRVDGQPRRIYWGCGDIGRVHELLTFRARRMREKRLQAIKDRKTAITEAGKGVKELVDWVRQFVRATRLLAGEYQHQGQWRVRGQPRTPPPNPTAEADWKAEVGVDDAGDPYRQLVQLNDRVNSRDLVALNELTGCLAPGSSLWTEHDERVQRAVIQWARLLTNGDEGAEAERTRETAEWSVALAGAVPTPAVRAAAGAAGVAFLAVRFGETEVSATAVGKRRAVLRRLKVAVKRLQLAVELVVAAKTVAVPAARPRPRVPASRKPRVASGAAA